MNKKILPLCLALMLILSSNMILLSSASPAGTISVDPTPIEFSTDPAEPNYRAVGDNFTVNIMAADFVEPGIYAYELKLFYDNTILECIAWELPEGHFLTPAEGEMPIGIVPNVYDVAGNHENGYALGAFYLQGDAAGKTGSGVLVTFTFEITQAPSAAGVLACDLVLGDVIFADPDINDVEVTPVNGYYEYAAPRPPLPYLKVEPEFVSAKEVGDEVFVDITIQELVADWRAVGFQWTLGYNTTILETKGEWITEGDFLKQFGETFFWAIQEDDYVISFSLQLGPGGEFPPPVFPEGSGTLATIKFNATYKPTFIDMVASCKLDLYDIIIVNDDAESIEIDPEVDGFYQIAIAPPPWLSIEPDTYTASAIDEEFPLVVFINELEADWQMVGAEFKIRYNLTMLELTNITEGGFMSFFADLAGTYTWFQYYVEEDPTSGYGIVGVMILPLVNATWPGPFPDTEDYGAPGDLTIVTFKAIYQHDTLDLTSDIYLDEIILANTAATEIPYDIAKTAEEGICKYTILKAIPPIPMGPYIDLQTQYISPYGGQGYGKPSDAFPPQGRAELIGEVLYNGDPVPGKPVAYKITCPRMNETYFGTAFSGTDGMATFEYLIPASEYYFGLWNIIAEVDIGGTVVRDHMAFRVGWLVKASSMELNYTVNEEIFAEKVDVGGLVSFTVYKNTTFELSVNLEVISMQDPIDCMILQDINYETIDIESILHIAVRDELDQIVAMELATLDIGEIPYSADFVLNEETREVSGITFGSIQIPYWAFSGDAEICANVLTDYPGVPYCREGIVILPIKKGP